MCARECVRARVCALVGWGDRGMGVRGNEGGVEETVPTAVGPEPLCLPAGSPGPAPTTMAFVSSGSKLAYTVFGVPV